MGSAGAAAAVPLEISSDEEDDERMPAAAGKRKSPERTLDWAERMLADEDDFDALGEGFGDPAAVQELLDSLMDAAGIVMGDRGSAVDDKHAVVRDVPGGGGDDDDDDCVILDGDPDKPVAVAKEEGPPRDAAEDELLIVAEKGELACRDFPHPRHLCATFLFRTSPHASHCSMCHCYVCDAPAPCAFWGKGTTHADHCHATDKDAKWKMLRQSSKTKIQPTPKRRTMQNFYHSSVTIPSSEPSANVNGSTGRLPVPSVMGQNQQVDPSIMAPRNVVQGISMLRAPSPVTRAAIPRHGSKSARVARPVYKPSNVNHLQSSLPSYGPMQPAQPRAFQTAQVPPGGRVSAGTFQSYRPPHYPAAPIGSQGHRYRPPSYQLSPNTVVGTGVPLTRYTSVATQGTQSPQVASDGTGCGSTLDSFARHLGVGDYNTNQPIGQQAASIPQSLHPSRVPAQAAEAQDGQWFQVKKSYVTATSQMMPSGQQNSLNHASLGSTVLSSGPVQIQQPLCQLNSQSSLTLSGTSPNTLFDGK